jgi:hypothetical protein
MCGRETLSPPWAWNHHLPPLFLSHFQSISLTNVCTRAHTHTTHAHTHKKKTALAQVTASLEKLLAQSVAKSKKLPELEKKYERLKQQMASAQEQMGQEIELLRSTVNTQVERCWGGGE